MNENASGKNILARLECDNGTLAARIITRHGQPAAIGFDYDSDGILIDGLSSGFLAIADDRFDRRNQEHCQSFERWEARCRAGGRGGATLSVHANDTVSPVPRAITWVTGAMVMVSPRISRLASTPFM